MLQRVMLTLRPPRRTPPLRLPRPLPPGQPLRPYSASAATAAAALAAASSPGHLHQTAPRVLATASVALTPLTAERAWSDRPRGGSPRAVGLHAGSAGAVAALAAAESGGAPAVNGAGSRAPVYLAVVTGDRLVIVDTPSQPPSNPVASSKQALPVVQPPAVLPRANPFYAGAAPVEPPTEAGRSTTDVATAAGTAALLAAPHARVVDAPHSLLASIEQPAATVVTLNYWQPPLPRQPGTALLLAVPGCRGSGGCQ